ncbi:MAG: T9SS type A sorting domain-containing protein [Bacteroidetes bacterium]|nr:T9SS type A sorting domain-containing protein [Bacteroidota bacterium]
MLTNFTQKVAYTTAMLGLLTTAAFAQTSIRPYTLAYSENLKGGTVMFGNTSMHIVDNGNVNLTKMNQTGNANNGVGGLGFSQYGNDNSNMTFIDVDGTTGDGAATKNSSSADLVLPAGTNTIRFARLYWGGRIANSTVNATPDTLRKIKIRKGTSGAYTSAITAASNVASFNIANTTDKVYQSFVDITQFVNTLGSGTYTVADIPSTAGSIGSGGAYAGWTIVVAYENTAVAYNSVRVYDGYAQVFNTGSATTLSVTLSGLNVPNNPLAADEAVMASMAWEGDANLYGSVTSPEGDFIKVNGIDVSNAMNPSTNFWNGSITKNGTNVTTKNPNYTNQMGIDIDEVNVGTGFNILPNATSVTVQFGTEQDQYFPSVFTFNIRMKDPLVTLDKTVTDASGDGYVDANEVLTYVLSGANSGNGIAYNTVVVDTLPTNVTYIPNTLEVVNGAGVSAGIKTDAQDNDEAFKGTANGKTYVKFFLGQNATGSTGGQLPAAPNGAYSVKFKVQAGAIPGSVINTARITANSQAGDVFTDDGTAVIGANGGPVPVKLTTFKAVLFNKNGLLTWSTESELNSDYFIVERSIDGVHFEARGKVAGNGTTSFTHNYSYTDVLNTNASVVYYRLKIVDVDAKYGFSKTVAIKLSGSLDINDFNVYPNPFISDIKVTVTATEDQMASFRVISFDGKEMINRKVSLQSGTNIVVLTDFGRIAKGNYILEVTTSTDKFIKKIIKN